MKIIAKILLFAFFCQSFWSFSDNTYASNGEGSETTSLKSEVQSSSRPIDLISSAPEIEIQSGLIRQEDGKYYCKNEACKVNLSLEKYIESIGSLNEYECKWDFGGGSWKTNGTDLKCNPGYVDYQPGKYNISVQISLKSDASISVSNSILFENNFYPISEEEEGKVILEDPIDDDQNMQEEKDKEQDNGSTSKEIYPDFAITIQSGLSQDENGLFQCKKQDCKVNLTIQDYIDSIPQDDNYSCIWDFGFGSWTTTNTNKKCNPGYVGYSKGDHIISVQVLSQDTLTEIQSAKLHFTNTFLISNQSTAVTNPNIENTGSGEQHTSDKIADTNADTESGTGFILPEIVIEIQSGLEKNGTGETYICKKSDCKVNLTLENIFTGSYIESDYKCLWDFGSGTSTVGTNEKCNPGYVTYGTGNHEILATVFYKDNSENVATGALNFSNYLHEIKTEEIDIIDNHTESENIRKQDSGTKDTKISEDDAVNESFIDEQLLLNYTLQQPSYIGSTIGENLYCDQNKKECKVNFLFEISHPKESINNFICRIYSDVKTKTIQTCNPATLTFPLGENKLRIEVLEKETLRIIKEKILVIHNNGYIQSSPGGGSSAKKNQVAPKKINIIKSDIIIQSGINEEGKCKKRDCKVNLIYPEQSGEKCEWSFPRGTYKESTTTKCNPGYIDYFEFGEYTISVKVYDKNYPENYITQNLTFKNLDPNLKNFPEAEKEIASKKVESDFTTEFIVKLQGKKTNFKSFSGSTIYCSQAPCNINLDASSSTRSNGDKTYLVWYYSDKEFQGSNPKGEWFQAGKHEIVIQDGAHTKILNVHVSSPENIGEIDKEKIEIEKEKIFDKNLKYSLAIHQVVPNPKGVDSNEYIEIINNGTLSINLKHLIIDDIENEGSKPYTIKEGIALSGGSTLRLYKSRTKLNLNNNKDSVILYYQGELVDSVSWDFAVPDNFSLSSLNTNIDSQSVFVKRVIDGDTIEIVLENNEIETLRLVGVDTPEIYNSPNALEKKYGEKAKVFTQQSLLGKHVTLELEAIDSRDRYGRLLGYIVLDDNTNFNELLIKKGYSRAYTRYDFKYSQAFKKAQVSAKKERLGIWESAQYKKILNKTLKDDKESHALSQEKIFLEEKEKFYKDENQNNIPDIFEAVKEEQGKYIDSENKSQTGSTIGKREIITLAENKYHEYINENYYLKVSKLQKGLKLSGKTIADIKLIFIINDTQYSTKSSNSGDFDIVLGNVLLEGEYSIITHIHDAYGNIIQIKKPKELHINGEYLEKLKSYASKKALSSKKKAAKKKKKATETVKKTKIYSDIFVKQAQADYSNVDLEYGNHSKKLTFILFVLLLIMLFFILKRKKLV